MKLKENKAITLIALVITIVVLLILSAVVLNLTIGENGLLSRTKQAKEDFKKANVEEVLKLAVLDSYDNGQLNKEELKVNLNKIDKLDPKIDEITTFPIQVIVDGYKYLIDENGDFLTESPYTISTDANGNTVLTPSTPGLSLKLPNGDSLVAPSGKAFKEWNTSADGTGTSYAGGEIISSDNIVYANWYKAAYTMGDLVIVGGERFYALETSNATATTIKLIAEKFVKTTSGTGQYTQTTSANPLNFDDSSSDYATSDIAREVNNYKEALEGRMEEGTSIESAELISFEECTSTVRSNVFSKFPSDERFWTKTAITTSNVLVKFSTKTGEGFANVDSSGINIYLRPVIVVLKAYI